jgi:hypothetical protein
MGARPRPKQHEHRHELGWREREADQLSLRDPRYDDRADHVAG